MTKIRLQYYSLHETRIYVAVENGSAYPGVPVVKKSNGETKYFFKYENSGELIPISVNGKNAVKFEQGILKLPKNLASYFD